MSDIKLSISASAVRPHLWTKFLDSLKGNKYDYEIIFSGFLDEELWRPFEEKYPQFKYIKTSDLKPSQNYEIARRACVGELIGWTADDVEYSEGYIDKVYDYWKSLNDYKVLLSCKTNENNMNEDMKNHSFFGRNWNTPRMAPLGIMSREYLNKLGGYDRRYICGQYENDVAMRVWADGGKVYIYEGVCASIDHKNKHSTETNFWSGYNEDREQLENSWVIGGYKTPPKEMLILPLKPGDLPPYWYFPLCNTEVTLKRNDEFVPFEDKDLLTISQKPTGKWSGNGA